MKYAVISPETYASVYDKVASEHQDALKAGFDGFFKEDYKNGMPFVTDIAVDDMIITDTTETPDIRPKETEKRVEMEEEWVFKQKENGEAEYVKQIVGTLENNGAAMQISMVAQCSNVDVEQMAREEVKMAVARQVREKHFEEIQDDTKIPILTKLREYI